ncbi:MAG TPA: hypothetical protein VNH83_22700 [Bryobacteraceae bacterium]|nr:hypothetical protein [Bryobacteraceae bacterium]
MTVTDAQWAWWQGAAQAPDFDVYLKAAPIHVDEPQSGFFEARRRNQQTNVVTRGVVAIWRKDDGTLVGRQDKDRSLTADQVTQQWPYLAKRPIPHATYKTWIDTGKFPDEITADQIARADGLNDVGDLDQHAMIKDRIEDLTREADKIIAKGAAKTQAEVDTAADLADRILRLEKRAETLRTEEKQPHLDAGREVDLKWGGLTAAAANAKNQLKRLVITPFMVAETARRDDEIRKAREQAAANNTPPPPAPKPVKAGVAAARKAGLREEKTAIIEDYAKVLNYFAANSKVRDLIQQLANASVKQGTVPDGCRLHVQQVAM